MMADLTTYLLVICVFSFVFWLKQQIARGRKRYPNGPFGLPVVGHLPFFGKLPTTTFFRWWQQYGDVFRIKLGSWNTVIVNGFSTIKEVTSHPKDAFSGRPKFISTEILKERTGEEIFSFGNFSPVYLKQHKMTKRALRMITSRRPEIVDDLVTSEASLFVDQMIKKCRTIPGYVQFEVQTFALRVSYQFMYGRGNDDDIDRKVKLLAKFHRELKVFTGSSIDVLPWLRYVMPWKITSLRENLSKLYAIQDEQVREHYEAFSSDDIRDVADAFLASDADDESNTDSYVLSRARLNNTLTELLSGGFHPTSGTLLWMLLYMAAYPDVQERVHEEIDTVVKGRNVSFKDRMNFPFSYSVILEVSRIVSLVPLATPHYAIMDAKIGDLDIDEGTVVLLNLHSVHHDKKYWGDPECFRPERFIKNDNMLDVGRCLHVLPFGVGRRSCIGEDLAKMNLFLAFVTIMQRCDFIKSPDEELDFTPIPGQTYDAKDFRVLVRERV